AVALFIDRHAVAGARQLLRTGQAGRPRTHDGDPLARLARGRLGHDPAFLPAALDDRVLDRLDADRLVIQVQRAGGLAGCGADAAGELGEIVGRQQHVECALPVLLVDQVVPVGDDVVDRAAVRTERHAAVHAARTLDAGLLVGQRRDEFLPVAQAAFRRLVGRLDPREFHEASDFSHDAMFLQAAWAWVWVACHSSPRARRYSSGVTLMKARRAWFQSSRISRARKLPV